MPEFDFDDLKKSWQEQEVKSPYESTDILKMLNKGSRNYVKYILWISIIEFAFLLAMNLFYLLQNEEQSSFVAIVEKIGLKSTDQMTKNFENMYLAMKFISILVTAAFVVIFYNNYKKIRIEENLKKLIHQIIKFKKTVNAFILTNITLLVIFSSILMIYIYYQISHQDLTISNEAFLGFIIGSVIGLLFAFFMIWLYYKIVYGIIMRRLAKNLEQLQEIETATE